MAAAVIALVGPAGSGKSVQAELLAKALGGVHLSSGDILRASASPAVQAEMRRGELPAEPEVDERLAAALVASPQDEPWILDGFIRLQTDLAWLETALQKLGRRLNSVIFLEISLEISLQRLAERGRADDASTVIAQRWQRYQEETEPIVRQLTEQGVAHRVDGVGTVAEVAARVEAAI